LLTRIADKPKPLARKGAYELLLLTAVANRPAHGVYSAGQRRLGYDPSTPDRGNEIVLADDAVAVLDEMDQKVEDLRLERNQLATSLELPTIRVEDVASEQDRQIPSPAGPDDTQAPRPHWTDNHAHPKEKSSFRARSFAASRAALLASETRAAHRRRTGSIGDRALVRLEAAQDPFDQMRR